MKHHEIEPNQSERAAMPKPCKTEVFLNSDKFFVAEFVNCCCFNRKLETGGDIVVSFTLNLQLTPQLLRQFGSFYGVF